MVNASIEGTEQQRFEEEQRDELIHKFEIYHNSPRAQSTVVKVVRQYRRGRTTKTKNNHCSSQSRTGDRRGQLTGHVTFTYKITRESYGTNFDCFEFLDPKMLETKKNHLSISTTTKVSNSPVSRSGLDL